RGEELRFLPSESRRCQAAGPLRGLERLEAWECGNKSGNQISTIALVSLLQSLSLSFTHTITFPIPPMAQKHTHTHTYTYIHIHIHTHTHTHTHTAALSTPT